LTDPRTVETVVAGATAGFRGRLHALSIADILNFLRGLKRKGLLSCAGEGTTIGLHLADGKVAHATSTREADRLTELLLRWGLMSQAQHDETMRRAAGGERIGKALIASGVLTPRALLEARSRQARWIGLSLFEWSSGEFAFLEGEDPPGDVLPVDLPILDLIAAGIRSLRASGLLRERMPSPDWVLEPLPLESQRAAVPLQPQEEYVLRLVDGTRTVGAIAEQSEFPDLETLRVLFLLVSIGYVKMKAHAGPEAEDLGLADEIGSILRRYNGMLGQVYQYLMREVGPISEHLLAKALRELKGEHPVLLSRAALGGDGTLDGEVLQENLRGLAGLRRRETLVQGLNELLYSELLVLRRTLGAEHEGRVLRALRRPPPATGAVLEEMA